MIPDFIIYIIGSLFILFLLSTFLGGITQLSSNHPAELPIGLSDSFKSLLGQ